MSHRTAAAALLIASLPYGLALPQVVPLVSELAPNVTPSPLSLISALNASSVTVIGTIVQPAVESAVQGVTDAIEDATVTIASALESAAAAVEDVLPTDAPSILDSEANILPLILPGILPVQTDLPPLDTEDAVPSDLPETNSLEVIDLPAPTEVPYGDDGIISEPFFPDSTNEATVSISTFNAVVQSLLTVIHTLLNSMAGNFAPPLPGILPHPLLPTETPEIFIDPLLPTETLSDAGAAMATDAIGPLIDPLVDPIPISSIAKDLPFTKRQNSASVDTDSISAILKPLVDCIFALIAQIPVVGPAVSDAVSTVEPAVPELPFDVPALPIDAPTLPIPDITLPDLPLPSLTLPDVLPTDDLPVDMPPPALPESPITTPSAWTDLTSAIPEDILNVPVSDDVQAINWAVFESPPFSDLPASSFEDVPIPEGINVPVPELNENGAPIDAVSDVAAANSDVVTVISDAATAISEALPTVLDAVADATAAVPATLPTSLDAFGDLSDDLLVWPFPEIPEAFAPDLTGELPDVSDFAIPDVVLNVPVPYLDDSGVPLDLPTEVAGLLLPISAPTLALPTDFLPVATDLHDVPVSTDLSDVAVPTDLPDVLVPTGLSDIPVPEGFENITGPPDISAALPAAPPLGDEADLPIPDDVSNIPWPDTHENGVPIDLPVDPADNLAAPPAALPTDLNVLDIPVPEEWVDVDDVASILPISAAPTDTVSDILPVSEVGEDFLKSPEVLGPIQSGLPVNLPAPALPTDAFGAGFPIQAFPDIPLVLPKVSDVASQLPAEDLLPKEGPAALTGAFTDVPTDAISGLPTSDLADVLPVITGLPAPLPTLPIAAASPVAVLTIPAVAPPVATPTLPAVAPVLAAPAVAAPALPAVPAAKLPFQVPGTRGVVGKRQLSKLIALPKPASNPSVAATAEAVDLLNKVLIKLSEALSLVLSNATKSLPKVVPTLPSVNPLASSLPLPSLSVVAPDVGGVVGGVIGGIVSSLPAPDLPSTLPAIPGLSDVAASDVNNIASVTTGPLAGEAPVVSDAAGVASTITSTVPAGLLSGLGPKLKKRSANEALQLLSELDESKQSELAGLIYHSSTAVENNDVDAMADVLKSDLENLSDDTKSALLKGFSASTIGKRSMRYARRQDFAGVPGVQSIGPELDDAEKVNVSGFNLDPNNQLNGLAAPGKLVDSTSPPTFEEVDAPVASLADPELLSILASGGLDPNGMLSSPAGGALVDDGFVEDPFAAIRQDLEPSFVGSAPLEGLDATLQAAKNNHFSGKTPRLSWVPTAGGSAAAQQAEAAAKQQAGAAATRQRQQQQGNVLQWFQRFVKPSWNKNVDAEIVR